jgi:hypothetical protein
MLFGRVTLFKAVHVKNILLPKITLVDKSSSNITFFKDVEPEKA